MWLEWWRICRIPDTVPLMTVTLRSDLRVAMDQHIDCNKQLEVKTADVKVYKHINILNFHTHIKDQIPGAVFNCAAKFRKIS